MKRKHFRQIDGFEEVLKMLESGTCIETDCDNCPFHSTNSKKGDSCVEKYCRKGVGMQDEDDKLIKSVNKFRKMLKKKEIKNENTTSNNDRS
jgi:hypothetical protein